MGGLNGIEDITGTTFNSTVIYSCEPGYQLITGFDEINFCTASGNWSQQTASDCEREQTVLYIVVGIPFSCFYSDY